MQRATTFFSTSIGKKVTMAVTGALLVLFVIVHMVGNLKVYQGPEKLDSYAHFLREFGYPVLGHEQFLWIFRIGLLVLVGLHVWSAIQVWAMSRSARPVGYKQRESIAATYASRTMRYGGIFLVLFIVYHILHFTTGQAHPSFEEGEAYRNLVVGFQQWYSSLIYIVAMCFLALHLYHGIWSGFQTLGFNDQHRDKRWRMLALIIAAVVFVGNVSIPVAVLTGIVGLQ